MRKTAPPAERAVDECTWEAPHPRAGHKVQQMRTWGPRSRGRWGRRGSREGSSRSAQAWGGVCGPHPTQQCPEPEPTQKAAKL